MGETIKLWIGTHPDPDKRSTIEVSKADYERIPERGSRSRKAVEVTDVTTGKPVKLRRASCGLPHCLCALEFVA